MRVAFCNRPTWESPLGGDGVQMLKTKEALEKLFDLKVDILTSPEQISSAYDIVHVFNFVTYEITRSFVDKAIALNIPIVSSSIFWDYTFAYDRFTNFFVRNNLSGISVRLLRVCVHLSGKFLGYPCFLSNRFKKQLRYMCQNSSIILPNSIEEGRLLQNFINEPDLEKKMCVVYNGVAQTETHHSLSEEDFFRRYDIPHNYILQISRIEPVKNQINLLYALKYDKDIPIVFLGKISNVKYYRKLKKLADKRGNVYFLDAIPHEEVNDFYKYAKLHVLLSLRESPGLVSLEALSNDCPIVVSSSQYTPVATYFSNQPYIVDPLNLTDIRNTILRAYKERILDKTSINNFSWNVAARQTYDAYKRIL